MSDQQLAMPAGGAAAAGGLNIFNLFRGTREACLTFDSDGGKEPIIDLYVICHEARGMDLSPGEQVFVSLRDTRKPDPERLAATGTPWHLKSTEADSILALRVWAAKDEASARADVNRRALGELRIPLRRLKQLQLQMLYQTWVTLDCPGLADSFASAGMVDETGGFDQKLLEGPKQLFQPRLCLSLCRLADVGSSGRCVLTPEDSGSHREKHWGALIRSQQQHVVMSAALYHQTQQQANEPSQPSEQDRSKTAKQIQETQSRVQDQAQLLQELRSQLQQRQRQQGGGYNDFRPSNGSGDNRQGHAIGSPRQGADAQQRTAAMEAQIDQIGYANAELKAEVDTLQTDLEKVQEEANSKIDSANERIRGLRKERDDALKEGDAARAEGERLQRTHDQLYKDRRLLSEQKEALLRIVEDLHTTCLGAGLPSAGRHSMKDIGDMAALFRAP
eukprot:TRINITY_DN11421_c0_g2_i1.p1 TRINITY_DN11421_c0_g2~~TRINITY_DN11421_c0_g2_i1.p1  ORF type:complete len:448 (-),score=99.04 TRINITY_DN11421_c0_g2_i1:109-1452(-)